VRVSDDSSHMAAAWSPARYLQGAKMLPFDDAVQHVRFVIEECVRQLAAGRQSFLAGVSGGLDSSIVAACLKRSGADFDCFTMYDEGTEADERSYARALADYLGVRLSECPYRLADVDLETSSVATLPRPIGWPFQQSLDKACLAIADKTDATAIVRGTGGDALFCYNNSASSVIDAFLEQGPITAARTCLDLSKVTGASLWQCLEAASRTARQRRRPAIRLDPSLLARDIVDRPEAMSYHPWLEECAAMPPGRQRQIDMLCGPHNAVETRFAVGRDISARC
jgi:asparagine synthase (glutamine-hydrolysing)